MRTALLICLTTLFVCMEISAQTPAEIAESWDKDHITTIQPSDVRHADLLKYLERLKKAGLKVEQVGESNAKRSIHQMEFGSGPLRVFMWSQMHGDEPTATSALVDLFHYLQNNRDRTWVQAIEKNLTIRALPMLNPDGAEAYQRRNLQGIDINRDAANLQTPEAQLLKRLRDAWSPAIGFNLHNQQSLTTVGSSPMQAAISLLVVFGDEAKTMTPGHERNQRVASAIVRALQNFIPGHIGRYGDEWTPTAFGDNFSSWGTSVILIETGALVGKDELYLVKMNYIAFVTALNALASGSEKQESPLPYLSLPENGSGGVTHLMFRAASLPNGTAPVDIAAVAQRRRASFPPLIKLTGVGRVGSLRGLEEYDASGFTVVQRFGTLKAGELCELFFYKRGRTVDWASPELEKQYPPDAIFSVGRWAKGEGLLPKK